MKAPYPYFGGKSTVASTIWKALGQPKHYIEPFCGSAAVLLARPDYNPQKHMETINDKDGFVCNAWRGMQFAPDELARYCDHPVNHCDLSARRKYMNDHQDLLLKLCDDPEYFDAKIAGYWIWAMSCWIGSGLIWPRARPDVANARGVHALCQIPQIVAGHECGVNRISQIPEIGDGKGINNQIPLSYETGVCRRPYISHAGVGVNQTSICKRPCFSAKSAHGVHKVTLVEESAPALDVRDPYTPGIYTWFRQLSERLRRVRVVCGDWTRVCGGNWQDDRGACGIFFDPKDTCGFFFDPPYDPEKCGRDPKIYTQESATVSEDVRNWCIERGEWKTYRIVLAGYYEEHKILEEKYGWTIHRWSAPGGFANRGKGNTKGEENRHKETLFFSPHCHSGGLKRFGLEVTDESGSASI
jgi:hypothetical protein